MASFVTIPLSLMRGVMEGMDHTLGVTPGAKAGCWTPAVDFQQSKGHLVVTAELPGLKKDEVKVTRPGHFGLPGIRERAKRIGARLGVWSESGPGTEVELTVPASVAYAGSIPRHGLRLFARERWNRDH